MIDDSVPWRQELLKVAAALERRSEIARWMTRTGFLVERDLMVGMFTIRRLIESARRRLCCHGSEFRWGYTHSRIVFPAFTTRSAFSAW